MRKYKVTKSNKAALCGRINKFKRSCENKRQVWKYNKVPIFSFLTMEQAVAASVAFPVITAHQVGLYVGDTVCFYGGNRIDIHRVDGKVDRLVRCIPKNGHTVQDFIDRCSKLKDTIPAEFIFDKVLVTNNKKRYASTVPLKDAQSINIGKSMQELAKLSKDVEDIDKTSMYPVEPIRLQAFPNLSNITSVKRVASSCEAMYLDD